MRSLKKYSRTLFIFLSLLIALQQQSSATDTVLLNRIQHLESLMNRVHWHTVLYDDFIMDSAAYASFAAASGQAHPGVACGRFRSNGGMDCAALVADKAYMEKGAYGLLYALDVDGPQPLLLILDRITVVENPRTCWVRSIPLPEAPSGEGFVLGSSDRAWEYSWREGALHRREVPQNRAQ